MSIELNGLIDLYKGVLYAKKLSNKSWEAHAYLGLSLIAATDDEDKALKLVESAEVIYRAMQAIDISCFPFAISREWGYLVEEIKKNNVPGILFKIKDTYEVTLSENTSATSN